MAALLPIGPSQWALAMTELKENPFEHGVTNQLVDSISRPVGLVVINWAFVEQSLAGIVEITSEAAQRAGIKVRRHRPYGPKLEYVRKVFVDVPEAKPFTERWQPLSDEMDKLETVRHALAHGTIGAYDADKKVLTFNKVNPDPSKSYHEIEDVLISVDNLERAANQALALARELMKLAGDMMDILGPKDAASDDVATRP